MVTRLPRSLVFLCALLVLAACGGGGSGATPTAGGDPTPTPVPDPGGGGGAPSPALETLTAKTSFTDDDLRHFLTRTHFGIEAATLASVRGEGLEAYIARQLGAMRPGSAIDQQAAARFLVPDDVGEVVTDRIEAWWLFLMRENPNALQEHVALFWHELFAASSRVTDDELMIVVVDYVNLFRHQGAGNLRALLTAMARDPLMLLFLDGALNDGGPGKLPNENFAREWFELFTLGRDEGYTQKDITEAARAFTGYEIDEGENGAPLARFDPERHDAGPKVVLGRTITSTPGQDDYAQMTDATLAFLDPVSGLPRTARWIARNMLERYVFLDPSDALVNELARVLVASGWELAPTFSALFRSEAFYSARARQGLLKGPVDHLVGFQRATGTSLEGEALAQQLRAMGQLPTSPPSVNGWPGGEVWLASSNMVRLANTVDALFEEHEAFDGFLPAPNASGDAVLDACARRLGVTLGAAERPTLRAILGAAGSPWDPAASPVRDQRLQDLLWALSQHPSYQVR